MFLDALSERLRGRVQLRSDGLGVYINAVEDVFGADVDFGQLVKVYSQPGESEQRRYSPAHARPRTASRSAASPTPTSSARPTSSVRTSTCG